MSTGMTGYNAGVFSMCILLPVLILTVAMFVPAMRRRPDVLYDVCAVLVLLVGYLSYSGGGQWLPSAISVALALLLLWWGYTRNVKKAAAGTAK